MVPWTVVYKTRDSEIFSQVVMAPISSAEAWSHVQRELPSSVILALVKGNHEVICRGSTEEDVVPAFGTYTTEWKGSTVYK